MTQDGTALAPQPIEIDPADLMADPHASFAELRAKHRVVRCSGVYTLLRATDVIGMFTDARTEQVEGADFARLQQVPDGAVKRFMQDILLFSNGNPHRAKRGLFARSFAYSAMHESRGLIRQVAERIVGQMQRGRSFDFVRGVAARVPAEMIAALLGLPETDAPYFAALVYQVARVLSPVYPHADHAQVEAATAELHDYVAHQLKSRMAAPTDDMLSGLVTRWQAEPDMPFDTLVNNVLILVLAGSDTTRAAFASLVALLLQHPAQWEAVKRDPALIPGAVSESLRYEPSVGSITRVATAPLRIGEHILPAGAFMRLSMMSAMRDPQLYPDPDRFDITRTGHPRLHLVFGLGPHRCLGEILARIEMEEGLAALISAAPYIRLEEPPRLLGFGGIRQVTPMIVRID